MQCHTELIPPTSVSHAVAVSFLSSNADNLALVKTSLLQIFDVTNDKLSLVGEYTLAGTVTGLARIKLVGTRTGGDALVISFKQAKFSLLEWDPENHRISTVSIHYYEGDNVISQPFGPSLADHHSILAVDPDSRCVALKFGARQLAILPFRQTGDDLADGEDMEMHAELQSSTLQVRQNADGLSQDNQTPYKSSFVLPLTALDPDLTHLVDLAFLYEYREPTFGILSGSLQPSSALADERKDCLSFTVFTLDLEQRASTNLTSVSKLPSDLRRVIPLPLPVGGALLVGTNELVHVDQSGKTNAVAVNEFARTGTSFSMVDQSFLNIKLEGCEIVPLDRKRGDLILILNDGSLAALNFKLLGRTVGGLSLTKLPSDKGGLALEATASCTASLKSNKLFIGSEDADSILVKWSKAAPLLSRKRSHARMLDTVVTYDEEERSGDEVDEDDLYAPEPDATGTELEIKESFDLGASEGYQIAIIDHLLCLGPINSVCVGRKEPSAEGGLELMAGTGRGRGGRLTCMNRKLVPQLARTSSLPEAQSVWSIHSRKKRKIDSELNEPDYDNLCFIYNGSTTKPYNLDLDGSYHELKDTDFEQEGETVEILTIAGGTRIVQCRDSEIRTYDAELGLSQIMPQADEKTDEELKVVHVSACDPYLMVLRHDNSVQIYQVEKNDDIEPLEMDANTTMNRIWTSGCLYRGPLTGDETAAFLMSEDGALKVLGLPSLQELYSAPALAFLPPVLSTEGTRIRAAGKETLAEILVANLGSETITSPYLIVRTSTDHLVFYEPFEYPRNTISEAQTWANILRFRKISSTYFPNVDETSTVHIGGRRATLKPTNLNRYCSVVITGSSLGVLLKETSSPPRILGVNVASNVRGFVPIHRKYCERGFAVTRGNTEILEYVLPDNTNFSTGWNVRKIDLGAEVRQVTFHEKGLYIVATCIETDFYFAEDDNRHHEQDEISLRPTIPQCSIHLLSSKSNSVLHSVDMPYSDCITNMKIMPLEISEHTHEQKSCLVVGSAALRGEDMPAKGAVTVFEIQDVVPDPDVPGSGFRLFALSREETKGAVTAVEGFKGGLIGTGQGLKLMVRGIKEDGSCLPVAFLDAQCQMTVLKSLGTTGLWLAGDCWKGVWFGGFVEEPYKLSLLGKTRTQMEVVAADFLPHDGQLYLMVADAEMDLHILQYDPENPKSLSGTRLLHRSTFHVGHCPTSMTLLPSTIATPLAEQDLTMTNGDDEDEQQERTEKSLSHILMTTASGSVSLITPLDEDIYRRLTTLQTHLTSVLEHAAGLNPRAYRAVSSEDFGARGVLDGGIIMRCGELGVTRRNDVLARAGMDEWDLKSDCDNISGRGLGYL